MSYEEDIQYKGIDLVEMESKICFIILLNVIILNGRRSMAEYLDLERNMKITLSMNIGMRVLSKRRVVNWRVCIIRHTDPRGQIKLSNNLLHTPTAALCLLSLLFLIILCFLYQSYFIRKKNSCHFCHWKQTYNSLTYNIFIRIVKSDSKMKSKLL